jgi:hypothetical protein
MIVARNGRIEAKTGHDHETASGGNLSRPWQLSGYPPKHHLHDREGSGTDSGTKPFAIMSALLRGGGCG